MTQALQTAGIPEERRRAYMGHEPGEDSHKTNYMRPWMAGELHMVNEGLQRLSWPDTGGLQAILHEGGR